MSTRKQCLHVTHYVRSPRRGANVCELPAIPAVYYDMLPHALQGAHPLQHSHTVAVGRLYGSSLLHGSPDISICPPSSHTGSDLQHRSAAKVYYRACPSWLQNGRTRRMSLHCCSKQVRSQAANLVMSWCSMLPMWICMVSGAMTIPLFENLPGGHCHLAVQCSPALPRQRWL